MESIKETILSALEMARGDDLHRVRAAFRGLTPEQMNEQYGQIGPMRQEILEGYERHNAAIDAAVAWVRGALEVE